jgi:hypothetical protein
MDPAPTSFATRPLLVALTGGSEVGAGLRVGYAPRLLPELGLEARVGGLPFEATYGGDLVVRPLARLYDLTPTARFGYTYSEQRSIFGGSVTPHSTVLAAAGLEWRAGFGLTLRGDVGVSARTSPNEATKVAPAFGLTVGYAFKFW